MVVDGAMHSSKFLQTSHAPETLHRRSLCGNGKWKFSTRLSSQLPVCCSQCAEFSLRCPVCREAIHHDFVPRTVSLHQCLEGFKWCLTVSTYADPGFELLTFVTYRASNTASLAIDLRKDNTNVPFQHRVCSNLLDSFQRIPDANIGPKWVYQ